jgi:RNA polymerase sigma-70 factor, ECF subfamily
MQPAPDSIMGLMAALRDGDTEARANFALLVYPQMRRIAQSLMRGERPDHTLQPTALVHEAYLRVFGDRVTCENREHFLAIAAQVMRQILVDHARRRKTVKRGAEVQRVDLDLAAASTEVPSDTLLALDAALTRLAEWDPRQSRIVELRFFVGLTEQEVAQALGLSVRTVKRDWSMAKAWLYSQIGE